MAKKPVLGKGLGAILGDINALYDDELMTGLKEDIPISQIRLNPSQPRKEFKKESIDELAASIKEYGLIQPVLLHLEDEGYTLIAGERRLRACKSLGLKTIKAIINDKHFKEMAEIALIENIQREDLNPLELAQAYKSLLLKQNLTHEELALKMHKSRSEITNSLRILNLDEDTKKLLEKGVLSKAHAKVLAGLEKKDEKKLAKSIVQKKLSVKDAEMLANELKGNSGKKKLVECEKLLAKLESLGFKATLKAGKITLEFKNDEEVREFYGLL